MASTKDYKEYILDNLESLNGITCRPMMGEYLLYYNGILFGGIYDDRLLVKIVDNNKKYHMEEAIPYKNAKPMFLVDNIDNQELLESIILDTYDGLIKNSGGVMEDKRITEEEATKEYEKGCKKAKKLLEDPDKVEEILQKLERKLKKIPFVGDTFSIVPAMISLVRSYIKGEYTEIPLGSIAGIISALIYILSPIDVVPDVVPGAGYLDDVAVLLVCLKAGASDDIKDYQKWREENNKNI